MSILLKRISLYLKTHFEFLIPLGPIVFFIAINNEHFSTSPIYSLLLGGLVGLIVFVASMIVYQRIIKGKDNETKHKNHS